MVQVGEGGHLMTKQLKKNQQIAAAQEQAIPEEMVLLRARIRN